jgi:hypothetical protein
MRPSPDHVRVFVLPLVGLTTLISGFALTSAPAFADSYGCTGSTQTLTVPSGASAATINLQGAAGEANAFGILGGFGANIEMTAPVTAGTPLVIEVGCQDGYPDAGDGTHVPSAGRGGGASFVYLNGTLFGVAGGGGAAGGQGGVANGAVGAGGAGGSADNPGFAGGLVYLDPASFAGQGGSGGEVGGQPGLGGQDETLNPGSDGTGGNPVQGGAGGGSNQDPPLGGGGGGGGYFGGGGGGGGSVDGGSGQDGGGGGGGGSSFVNTGGGAQETGVFSTVPGDGSIAINYLYTGPVIAAPNPVEFGQVNSEAGGTSDETVTLTNIGSGDDLPVAVERVTIGGVDASNFSIVGGGDNCSLATLTSEEICTVQVAYQPSVGSEGDDTAVLVFPSNSAVGTVTAALRGTAILPGTQGLQANPGAQGTTGAQGATGAAGVGAPGGEGPVGATGPAGQSGPPYKKLSGVTLRSDTLTACMGCLSNGLTLSYKLARAGHLHMRLERQAAGRWHSIGTATLSAGAGLHHFTFDASFAGRPLHGGSYRLVVQSQSSKGLSEPVVLRFTIAPL